MESVINELYLKEYTNRFTESISDNFFTDKSFISGEDILQLTQLKQINLMIVKKLMDKYQYNLKEDVLNPFLENDNFLALLRLRPPLTN